MMTSNKPTEWFVGPLLGLGDLKISTYYLEVCRGFFLFIQSNYAHTNYSVSIDILARCCFQSVFIGTDIWLRVW